jgi:hypothetical protein
MNKTTLLVLAALAGIVAPVPAHALTWKEFWDPFTVDRIYIDGYHRRPYYYVEPQRQRLCREQVRREEYVPGYWVNEYNYRRPHTKITLEWETYPC